MTPEEISQIYDQLTELEIRLEQKPELGTDYLKDKLLECRQKQNTVTDLIVRINRAYSAARQAVRAQEAAVRVAGVSQRGAELRDELGKMHDERDALKYLIEALNVRRANLGRTSSDIRLMNGIIETEMGNANAGQRRPPVKPPAPTPQPETTAPAAPAPPVNFEKGVQELVAKVPVPQEIVVPLQTEAPIVDASELLDDTPAPKFENGAAPPAERKPDSVEAAPAPKMDVKEPKEPKAPKAPPKPTLAEDDEVSMDEFLES